MEGSEDLYNNIYLLAWQMYDRLELGLGLIRSLRISFIHSILKEIWYEPMLS